MSTIIQSTTPSADLTSPPPGTELPRLEPGDHLSRDEFERRYEARPDIPKAELIEGVV